MSIASQSRFGLLCSGCFNLLIDDWKATLQREEQELNQIIHPLQTNTDKERRKGLQMVNRSN